jgi:hypothetical protein
MPRGELFTVRGVISEQNQTERWKRGKMRLTRNPGRVAGLWYLLLVLLGPLRLIYIPSKLFVAGNATATVSNIAAHETLFRLGMASDLAGAVVLIFLTLAFYRLFAAVDRNLAVQVVIFGGVMPSILYFVGVASDLGVLLVARGADFLSVFDKPQRDALAMLLLQLRGRGAVGSLAVSAGSAGVPVAVSAEVFGGVAGLQWDRLCGAQLYGRALAGTAAHGVCLLAACDVWGDGVDALAGGSGDEAAGAGNLTVGRWFGGKENDRSVRLLRWEEPWPN